jgi:hypothetical protein
MWSTPSNNSLLLCKLLWKLCTLGHSPRKQWHWTKLCKCTTGSLECCASLQRLWMTAGLWRRQQELPQTYRRQADLAGDIAAFNGISTRSATGRAQFANQTAQATRFH